MRLFRPACFLLVLAGSTPVLAQTGSPSPASLLGSVSKENAWVVDILTKSTPDRDQSAELNRLKALEGDWEVSGTFFFPDGINVPTAGTATARMFAGGRFLRREISVTTLNKKSEQMDILGYDKTRAVFEWTNAATTESSLVHAEGTFVPALDRLVFTLRESTKDGAQKVETAIQVIGDRELVEEFVLIGPAGQRYKFEERRYKRK